MCYLHKDYVKLVEEIFPKPTAHSQQSVLLSVSRKNQLEMWRGAEGVVFLKEKYIYIYIFT